MDGSVPSSTASVTINGQNTQGVALNSNFGWPCTPASKMIHTPEFVEFKGCPKLDKIRQKNKKRKENKKF